LVHNDCAVRAATRVDGGGVDAGKTLTDKQAIQRLQREQDVITDSRAQAQQLQDKASGGNIVEKAHKPEQLDHVHGKDRDTGHAFIENKE
jgi:hypothetical protein